MSENLLTMQRQVHQGQPHFQQQSAGQVAQQGEPLSDASSGQRANQHPGTPQHDVAPPSAG